MLSIAPYFGYLASLMLIIALLVKNDIKFRWFNTAGNIAFIIYGIVLGTVPVLITNLILLGINLYYLIRIYNRQENFDLIEFTGEEKLINKFISYHQKDIQLYFPEFTKEAFKNNLSFVVLRDLVIANMFCASVNESGDAEVLINYTLPKYRDYKVGRFIFEKEKQFLLSKGVKRIVYKKVAHPRHYSRTR
jgi:Bacterial inner membrane protein